ncbi:MAG TPA: alpha/beta hydrolase [Polyangiaceae bacterium]|nr:alpha/beta hydrolase [Polyangiaceae bacterium]
MKTRAKKSEDRPLFAESLAEGSDGTRLYVRWRDGPHQTTALLSDGIVCDGYIYKYLWEDLSHIVSVAHWNYRGHGRSALPADPERITVLDHAHDLDAVRRHLGDPPVVLVGHSFGTQVALEAYRLRPEKVVALVLLCGSFGRVTYTFKGSDMLAGVLPGLIAFAEQHKKLARAVWSRLPVRFGLELARLTGDVNLAAVRPEDLEPYFRHAAHVDFEMFLRMLREAGEHSAEDVLAQVRVPALVLAGDRDSFTPSEVSEVMARLLPRAEFELVPGGTHALPLEERERVRQSIAAFLTRVLVE